MAVRAAVPAGIRIETLLGGLAPDSDAPMPPQMRQSIAGIWRTIQQRVPGTEFNFDFWECCRPRRSTWPACRAVIAARLQGAEHEQPMILAIQRAYYLQARNPSEDETLVELAGEIGLDASRLGRDLASEAVHAALLDEIAQARRLGADSFPSLVLVEDRRIRLLTVDYRDPGAILAQL